MKRSLVLALALVACGPPTRGDAYAKSLAEARRAHHDGRFGDAAMKFDDAAKTAKVPRDAIYMRYEAALARARAGDHVRACEELRAIAEMKPKHPYSALAAFKAADLASDSDPLAGYRELENVTITYPESGVARSALLRVVRHDDQVEGGGAEKALAHLEMLAPRVKGTRIEETVLYERARRLDILGRTEQARDAYLQIADRFPYPGGSYFDDSLYRASEAEEKLGRPNEAIAHLERLLLFRESAHLMGSYERPRYAPSALRIAKLYEENLKNRAMARESLHRFYRDFTTSTMRDDALFREADLWRTDGDNATSCARLATLASDFPDSRYVPCATQLCPEVKRPTKSKAPKECHPYLLRAKEAEPKAP